MTPRQIGFFLQELRAPFFTASIVPVALGAALAHWQTGHFDGSLFFFTLVGVVLIHAGGNTANDYYDHRSGNDAANTRFVRPFTGGTRLIQKGLLTPAQVLGLSLGCFSLGGAIGLWLALRAGWVVAVLGAAGIAGGFCYTAPPLKLGYRGWGELVVGVVFGVLPVMGAYYVQTRTLSPGIVLASLPVAVLVTAILFVNQFPDYEADRAVGKRNWVVRLGPSAARPAYTLLMLLWPLLIVTAVLCHALPPVALWALIGLIPSGLAMAIVWRHCAAPARMATANGLTIAIHLGVGLLLAAGVAVARVNP